MSNKHPLADCENCPLRDAPMVPTSGPLDAKIAFVSRSPGKHDVKVGKPFGGPSGKVLDHLLSKYGVDRDEIITTNVVLCQSDDPPVEAIKACKQRLESEISRCDLIIAGGSEATGALTRYKGVVRARGFSINRTIPERLDPQRVVVTNNPAFVYKQSDAYPDMLRDFKRALDPPPPPIMPKVEIIDEPDKACAILTKWCSTDFANPIASDLEWDRHTGEPACAGFAATGQKAVVFGIASLRDGRVRGLLRQFYERQDVQFIWHNGKSDTGILSKLNINAGLDEDTFLLSYALDERPGYHALEYLLSEWFAWPDYEPQIVKDFKKKDGGIKVLKTRKDWFDLYNYNGRDTAGTALLFELLRKKVGDDNLDNLYRRLLRASNALRAVELAGFNFDVVEACNVREREVLPRLWEIEEELREISKLELLNPRSPTQVSALWYGQWGLKHKLRDSGKKKLSTSAGKEVREVITLGDFTCKPRHRAQLESFCKSYARYQKVDTIRKNFIDGLAIRTQQDGKLYCNFNPGGTVTGRLSSSDPNFQNIIREGYEEIPSIRTLFLPSEGNVILSADFNQAELRTCAILSGDPELLAIYADSSRSLHKERALRFYGKDYTKEQYVKSKNINFGVTYWQSAESFAQMYHMPLAEAKEYTNDWWRQFKQLRKWTEQTSLEALREGYVESPFGHRRRFHLITDENINDLRREAINFRPQNIAGWLTICALCELVDLGIAVVASVHDSIVCDVPAHSVDSTAALIKQVMEKQAVEQLGEEWGIIPFTSDVSYGPNWGQLSELRLVA